MNFRHIDDVGQNLLIGSQLLDGVQLSTAQLVVFPDPGSYLFLTLLRCLR